MIRAGLIILCVIIGPQITGRGGFSSPGVCAIYVYLVNRRCTVVDEKNMFTLPDGAVVSRLLH